MNKIKEKVSAGVSLADKENKKIQVNISVGVCEYDDSSKTEKELFEKADTALYADKKKRQLK
jgi:predicted signal transduction protein with EAL and GGDEF domain